jgi:plasmid stabilization system protein ParE
VPDRLRLVVTPPAELDIDDAANWYENRVTGLGVRFLEAVDASFESITTSPAQYPVVHRDVRRILLPSFPYAVFFVMRDDIVRVIACMHARRHPKRWQRRR